MPFVILQMFACNVCSRVFNTFGNYNSHVARHSDANQHQCNECGKVFARQDNFLRHLDSQHNEGGLHSDALGYKERRRMNRNVRDLYRVTTVKEVNMQKFKTKETEYVYNVNDDLNINGFVSVMKTLRKVFQSLIDTVTEGALPHDLVRMVVICPEVD